MMKIKFTSVNVMNVGEICYDHVEVVMLLGIIALYTKMYDFLFCSFLSHFSMHLSLALFSSYLLHFFS